MEGMERRGVETSRERRREVEREGEGKREEWRERREGWKRKP